MNFASVYERQKRPTQMFHPMHSSVASYWTEALHKSEMKQEYGDFLNNLHLIPDPLKKNLADTLITNEMPSKPKKPEKIENTAMPLPKEENTGTTALGGIGSFFSGVLNVLSSVMFRTRSPGYYECFDDGQQGAPQSWHRAKTNVQDKNGNGKSYDAPTNVNVSTDMNSDRTVTSCETKLNQVLNLLTPKQTASNPVWVRKRPKKVFVEPSSVSDSFEDAFSPEDFINMPEDPFYPCHSPMQYQNPELYETAAQKTKLNEPIEENMEIVKDVKKNDLELKKDSNEICQEKDSLPENNLNLDNESQKCSVEQTLQSDKSNTEQKLEKDDSDKQQLENTLETNITKNCQLVTSCEDKLSKLKALLLEKRKKTQITVPETEPQPTEKKPADKHYKNPNRRTNKRRKTKMRCKIEDDLVFANELTVETPPSVENSPRDHNVNFGDYFDELKGRFRSASIGSEDSFQIVFNDSPKQGRIRTTSDCDSEDSFIVFEDSPDSCYLSNDVFGSDSELSDSGCVETYKLSHSLTRTVSNLADDSLYMESEDEVDFAETICENTGLLLDDKKKQLRKNLPTKKVHFSPAPPKVHVMRVWAFAARQARAGHWERYAVDRERFKRRIADVDVAISWALRPQHRRRVMFQRFMPWWNQQKRRELAEKKEEEARKEQEAKEELMKEDTKTEQVVGLEHVTEEAAKRNEDLKTKVLEVTEKELKTDLHIEGVKTVTEDARNEKEVNEEVNKELQMDSTQNELKKELHIEDKEPNQDIKQLEEERIDNVGKNEKESQEIAKEELDNQLKGVNDQDVKLVEKDKNNDEKERDNQKNLNVVQDNRSTGNENQHVKNKDVCNNNKEGTSNLLEVKELTGEENLINNNVCNKQVNSVQEDVRNINKDLCNVNS